MRPELQPLPRSVYRAARAQGRIAPTSPLASSAPCTARPTSGVLKIVVSTLASTLGWRLKARPAGGTCPLGYSVLRACLPEVWMVGGMGAILPLWSLLSLLSHGLYLLLL